MSLRNLSTVLGTIAVAGVSILGQGRPPQDPSDTKNADRGARPRIVVEPDVYASRDGNNPHVEVMVAANPRRAGNLIGGAITHTRPDGTPATKAYVTFDGGLTWTDRAFPEQVANGGGDPQVAFTPVGTALFATLNRASDEKGRTGTFLHVYRSEDGGLAWSKPADLGSSYDHEMLTVDQTTGRFAGRVYISTLYGGGEYKLGVFRSDDDGRSFIGPVEFYRTGGKTLGANVQQMGVFSDGAVLATYFEFALGPRETRPPRSGFFSVISEDGGVTFSKPRPAPDAIYPAYDRSAVRMVGDQGVAIDTGERYKDRVYRVWNDARFGNLRIVISTSTDRGATWTEPQILDTAVPASAHQFLPSIAVNKAGVVGVSWHETRDASGSEFGYNVYFSASTDGGRTFLPPVRVSTELSRPHSSGNLMFTPETSKFPDDDGSIRMTFLSAAGRWGNGGEYGGLAVDAGGVFHPFWADSRTGTFQAMSARVRVDESPVPATQTVTGIVSTRNKVDVTTRIAFVNDPSRYDGATKELELRIRVKNLSERPIYGPITVTIKKFGSGLGEQWRDRKPAVLNAANGKSDEGATFEYADALGTERVLAPAGISGPVLLRFRVTDPLQIPDMHLIVEGYVAR